MDDAALRIQELERQRDADAVRIHSLEEELAALDQEIAGYREFLSLVDWTCGCFPGSASNPIPVGSIIKNRDPGDEI